MRFIAIVALILCCSCNKIASYRVPQYERDANAVTAHAARKINHQTGLKLIGTGGGMINQINFMAMSFSHYGDLSIEEARELLVYCVEEYLNAINADEKIKPHLVRYPFTPREIEVNIFIRKQDGKNQSVGSLSVVGEVNGKVTYDISQPFPKIAQEVYKETYEEAKKLVEQQDPGMKKIKMIKS